jgi:hypothetical protein
MRTRFLATLLAVACMAAPAARADITTVFTDSFLSETAAYNPAANPWQTLNFNNFQNWTVTRGSVDLVNTGGVYPSIWFSHGVPFAPSFTFVDLDGTSNQSGQITSATAFNLAPGNYRLSFDLAGAQGRDQQHHPDGVTVRLDGLGLTNHYELAFDDPFSTQNLDFTVTTPTSTTISFANESDDLNSLNDNQGPLLANITLQNLTGGIANVPEPSSIAVALGLAGSLLAARCYAARRRRLPRAA